MAMPSLHGKRIKCVYLINHPVEKNIDGQLLFWVEDYGDRTESWVVKLVNNVEICRYNIIDVSKIEWLL